MFLGCVVSSLFYHLFSFFVFPFVFFFFACSLLLICLLYLVISLLLLSRFSSSRLLSSCLLFSFCSSAFSPSHISLSCLTSIFHFFFSPSCRRDAMLLSDTCPRKNCCTSDGLTVIVGSCLVVVHASHFRCTSTTRGQELATSTTREPLLWSSEVASDEFC